MLRFVIALLLAAAVSWAAADNSSVAARLAKKAEQARKSGQLVRAYLLYAEAAARDPKQGTYAMNRDGLAPLAKLLSTANVEQNVTIADDIRQAEQEQGPSPFEPLQEALEPGAPSLAGLPHLEFEAGLHSFDLRGDSKTVLKQVALAYGVKILFDPEFETRDAGRFALSDANFQTAMNAATAVSDTFVFPVDAHTIFAAHDTELKRDEYEPLVLLSVSLPDAVEVKDVVDAANAVRGALGLREIAWDDVSHEVILRGRVTKVRAAAGLLQALVLPRAQLLFKVQIIAVDSSRSFHYGLALPTSFPAFSFAQLGALQSGFPDVSSATSGLFAFALGHSFFGVALGNATAYATYTKSVSNVLYEATVAVGDGQTASLHVGDKYPIPQSIYTGASQSSLPGVYNPIGNVTLEDLGIVLKLSPHITGSGDVSLDLEADYKALSGVTYNTVPAVSERVFKGSVRIPENDYAIIAGLTDDESSINKSGLPGLSQIPGIDQVLAENQRTRSSSDTLLLIEPTITRLPMEGTISPQFLLGSVHGARVVL